MPSRRTKPVYGQHRVGGSVGGPLVQNRTHFFGAYEFTDIGKESIIALPGSNPFAARENGTFPATSREHLLMTKVDHRLTQTLALRALRLDDQCGDAHVHTVSSDSANVNDASKMHSVIGEQNWVLSNTTVNTLRAHYMWNEVATLPVVRGVPQEVRPSVTTGQNWTSPQFFPRTRIQIFDTLYKTAGRHDLKFGGDYTYADAHLRRALLRERLLAVLDRCAVQRQRAGDLADRVHPTDDGRATTTTRTSSPPTCRTTGEWPTGCA